MLDVEHINSAASNTGEGSKITCVLPWIQIKWSDGMQIQWIVWCNSGL